MSTHCVRLVLVCMRMLYSPWFMNLPRMLGCLAALYCATALTSPARALAPDQPLSQYGHNVWTTRDGLPQNSAAAIVQTRDGYLWLATLEGLVRFDGVRFTVFDRTNTPALGSNRILSLAEDAEGGLWVGTENGGVCRVSNGEWSTYTSDDGLPGNVVTDILCARDGGIWFTTTRGLGRLEAGRFTSLTSRDGLPGSPLTSMLEDTSGRLWVGSEKEGLCVLEGGRVVTPATFASLATTGVQSFRETRDGAIWIGTREGLYRYDGQRMTAVGLDRRIAHVFSLLEDRDGNLWIGTWLGGLFRMSGGTIESYSVQEGLSSMSVWSLYEDHEGSLWVGTNGGGLNRLKNASFTTIGKREGLAPEFIWTVMESSDGALWAGTNGGGVTRIKDGIATPYTTRDGLSDNMVWSLAETPDGSIWVGTSDGLNRLANGRITTYASAQGLPDTFIRALHAGRDGRLWIGTNQGVFVREGNTFHGYTTANGLPVNQIRCIEQSRDGAVWVGTTAGVGVLRGGRVTSYSIQDGLRSPILRSLHEDREGRMWVGTEGGGLHCFVDGRFAACTRGQGLFDNVVSTILEDDAGNLWISCNRGVFRVAKEEAFAVVTGRAASLSSTAYDENDGMRSKECNGTSQPAGWRGRDGMLWFPTTDGLAGIDPKRVFRNANPPPVHVERLTIDGVDLLADQNVAVGPGSRRVEFHFTALSFLDPAKVAFRYKLEGFDPDWSNATTTRSASYTNLPPGTYVFRVIASNNDGVWNDVGFSLTVEMQPYFFQTRWFILLCVLGTVLIAASAYTVRVRNLKARRDELARLVAARTGELAEVNAQLELLSRQDSLTGVATRRVFDEALEREWRRALRSKCELAVILLDVDHFKKFNDTYGHQQGDECLRQVARILATAARRDADVVARYGGEEFAVILPDTQEEGAIIVAEMLRAGVAALEIPHEGLPTATVVTISLGVAAATPSPEESAHALVEAADQALYRAKHNGRNQIATRPPDV